MDNRARLIEAFRNNPENTLNRIKSGHLLYGFNRNAISADRSLIANFYSIHPSALEIASDEIKNDREFLLEILTENVDSFKYTSPQLKSDKDFSMVVIQKNPESFVHVSSELKNDKDFVLAVLKKYPKISDWVPAKMLRYKEIVLAIYQNANQIFSVLSEDFHKDEDIIMAAIKNETDKKLVEKAVLDYHLFKPEIVSAAISNGVILYAQKPRTLMLNDEIDVINICIKNYYQINPNEIENNILFDLSNGVIFNFLKYDPNTYEQFPEELKKNSLVASEYRINTLIERYLGPCGYKEQNAYGSIPKVPSEIVEAIRRIRNKNTPLEEYDNLFHSFDSKILQFNLEDNKKILHELVITNPEFFELVLVLSDSQHDFKVEQARIAVDISISENSQYLVSSEFSEEAVSNKLDIPLILLEKDIHFINANKYPDCLEFLNFPKSFRFNEKVIAKLITGTNKCLFEVIAGMNSSFFEEIKSSISEIMKMTEVEEAIDQLGDPLKIKYQAYAES